MRARTFFEHEVIIFREDVDETSHTLSSRIRFEQHFYTHDNLQREARTGLVKEGSTETSK